MTRSYVWKKPSEQRFCVICGLEFTARRSDKRCCSPRCSQKRHQLESADFVREAKDRPCEDCGLSWPPYVMHFHHLRDKEFPISKMARSVSRKRLAAEIAKCVVLCANCHAIRHGGDNLSSVPPDSV